MNYKRITERLYGGTTVSVNGKVYYDEVADIVERLAELEDKIENGTYIELPCKAGDTVYHIYKSAFGNYFIDEETVYGYEYDNDGIGWRLRLGTCSPAITCLGDNIFLTREEARKKLEKLRGDREVNKREISR